MDSVQMGICQRQAGEAALQTHFFPTSRASQPGTSVLIYKGQRKSTNQKATGSNPVGCTTKTLDELRAVEGFSFAVLKQFFLILLDFFEFDPPQRALLSRRRAAAFFALEPVDSGSFVKNGRFGTNHGTKPVRGMPFFPCAASVVTSRSGLRRWCVLVMKMWCNTQETWSRGAHGCQRASAGEDIQRPSEKHPVYFEVRY